MALSSSSLSSSPSPSPYVVLLLFGCATWICCYHYHRRLHRLHALYFFFIFLGRVSCYCCVCFFSGEGTTSCALSFENTVCCIHNNGKCILNTNFLCAYIILFLLSLRLCYFVRCFCFFTIIFSTLSRYIFLTFHFYYHL